MLSHILLRFAKRLYKFDTFNIKRLESVRLQVVTDEERKVVEAVLQFKNAIASRHSDLLIIPEREVELLLHFLSISIFLEVVLVDVYCYYHGARC